VDGALQLDASGVIVLRTASPLTSTQEDELKTLVDPLQDSSNYAIEVYDQVLQFWIMLSKNYYARLQYNFLIKFLAS
jgi:hypothetical protein